MAFDLDAYLKSQVSGVQAEEEQPIEQPATPEVETTEPFDLDSYLKSTVSGEQLTPEDLLPQPPKQTDDPEIDEKQTEEQKLLYNMLKV